MHAHTLGLSLATVRDHITDWRSASGVAGVVVGLAGCALVGAGRWAGRDVRRTLERERIVSTPDATPPDQPVTTAGGARSMSEVIRRNTIEATRGRTYAEIEPYVDEQGRPTSDGGRAARDERTGGRLENPEHALWVQSTTLQTALIQAYMAFRLAELTTAVGVALVATGAGLATLGFRPHER